MVIDIIILVVYLILIITVWAVIGSRTIILPLIADARIVLLIFLIRVKLVLWINLIWIKPVLWIHLIWIKPVLRIHLVWVKPVLLIPLIRIKAIWLIIIHIVVYWRIIIIIRLWLTKSNIIQSLVYHFIIILVFLFLDFSFFRWIHFSTAITAEIRLIIIYISTPLALHLRLPPEASLIQQHFTVKAAKGQPFYAKTIIHN